MRERAALLNGECQVNSQPGVGTLIQVHVPLQPVSP
jgi:signal transduction histidine kinase